MSGIIYSGSGTDHKIGEQGSAVLVYLQWSNIWVILTMLCKKDTKQQQQQRDAAAYQLLYIVNHSQIKSL